jgi:hypothetical protein
VSEKSESVLPDEPSSLKTTVEVISTASLEGSDVQTDAVNLDQSETQVCYKDAVRDEDQHIPVKSPKVEEGGIPKEQAFQLLLNVLTGNYSDIPQVKAFKDSIIAAFSNQTIAQTTNQGEAHPVSLTAQQQSHEVSEVHNITDPKSPYGYEYLSDNNLGKKKLGESASSIEDTPVQSKVIQEPLVHVLQTEDISKPYPESKITSESTYIQPDSTVVQWSPKLEVPRNFDMNIVSMDESLYATLNPMKTEPPTAERSAERDSDKDAKDHDPTAVSLQHKHVKEETSHNTVQSAPSFQEHCADEEDDDYEEYVTNDEMDEEDYEEEEDEEIKLIMENIIAVSESPKCSTGHENILNLQDNNIENQLVLKTEPEIVPQASDPTEQAEKKDSLKFTTMIGADVSAPSPQGMFTQDPPHSPGPIANDTTPSSNAESTNAISNIFTSTDTKAPVPPKRKSAKRFINPPCITTPTTSNNNEDIIKHNTTDVTQPSSSELEVLQKTHNDNYSDAFVRETNVTANEHMQPTALYHDETDSSKKQDEVTSPTTDVSSKVIDQFQFEVSLKVRKII